MRLLRLKKRTAVAIGVILLALWFASSCGGDGDDDNDANGGSPDDGTPATVDPNAPTATPTEDPANALPTLSPERTNETLLQEAQTIAFALEGAGGLRDACDSPPCSAATRFQNWEVAGNRCALIESLANVRESGPEAYTALYDGVVATCASVTDAMAGLSGESTDEEHEERATGALGGLPELIAEAVASGS